MERRLVMVWVAALLTIACTLLCANSACAQRRPICSESFESGWPDGWSRGDDNNVNETNCENGHYGYAHDYWGVVDCRHQLDSHSAWCAQHHSDHEGGDPGNVCNHYYDCMGAYMITRRCDLSGYTNDSLSFYCWVSTRISGDNLRAYYSGDSVNWLGPLMNIHDHAENWTRHAFAIPGSWSSVWVKWRFTGTVDVDIDHEGAYVDNFQITGDPCPGQVTGITATSNSCDNITICWTDVANETGYYVYRNGTQVCNVGANVTCCTDTPPAGTYSYTVAAYSTACGTGPISAPPVSGTRLGPPSQVTGVTATNNGCDNVTICWGDVANESGFYVYRNGSPVCDVPANVTCCTDAPPVGTYNYTVAAHNIACGVGPISAPPASGARLGPPPQVTNVSATNNSCNNIVISWSDVANETGYRVYRDGAPEPVCNVGANVTSCADASPEGNHCYTLIAYNACGGGAASTPPACGSRLGPPPQVTGVTATDNRCDSVIVTWNGVANETGYFVYRNGTQVCDVPASVTRCADAPPVGNYDYTVAAHNVCGNGVLSYPDGGTRLGAPAQVTGVSATDNSCSSITICWTDVSQETGYYVYRSGVPVDTIGANVTCVSDLPPTGTYRYSVGAFNACGIGPLSGTDSGTRLPAAAAPSNCQASDTSCSFVYVAWQDNSTNEDGFRIFRDNNQVGSVQANRTWFYDYPEQGTYIYTVCAFTTACGNSAMSNPDTGIRLLCSPDSLVVLYDAGNHLLRLYWKPIRDANGDPTPNITYSVYRGNTPDVIPSIENLRFSTQSTQGPDVMDEPFGRAFYIVTASRP